MPLGKQDPGDEKIQKENISRNSSTARFHSRESFKGFQIPLRSIRCSLHRPASWNLACDRKERQSILKAWISQGFGGNLTNVITIWNPSRSLSLCHEAEVLRSDIWLWPCSEQDMLEIMMHCFSNATQMSFMSVEPAFWVEPNKAYRIAPHTSSPVILFQNKWHVEPKKICPDLAFQSPDNIKPVRPFQKPTEYWSAAGIPEVCVMLLQVFHMQEKMELNVLCRERGMRKKRCALEFFVFRV